ncbi:MAG: polysaccharide biosynthesis/export family protein [Acidobacteriaceae bacterium]|nr:polysaccharide biosynthesis/export family protein [Acidobacteriaceae bacterium]
MLFTCAAGALAQEQTPPPTPPPAQSTGTGGDSKVASVPIPKGAGAPVDSSSYKIGAADVLYINVWHEPEFSGNFAVHEDGKITIPLVGDLQAGGKTPVEVQDVVGESLKKYVVKPLVTVIVAEVGSKRYYMDGLIARPGEYSLVVPTTILEAISKAGGLQDFANSKHIYVLRGDKRIYFNYKEVIRGRRMEQNIKLEPSDHVVVP